MMLDSVGWSGGWDCIAGVGGWKIDEHDSRMDSPMVFDAFVELRAPIDGIESMKTHDLTSFCLLSPLPFPFTFVSVICFVG